MFFIVQFGRIRTVSVIAKLPIRRDEILERVDSDVPDHAFRFPDAGRQSSRIDIGGTIFVGAEYIEWIHFVDDPVTIPIFKMMTFDRKILSAMLIVGQS